MRDSLVRRMPPGFELTQYKPGRNVTFVEIEGPAQPDSRGGQSESFPGGIALYFPRLEDELDPRVAARRAAVCYTVWALHEALEFVRDRDGRPIARAHETSAFAEDEMWSWLTDRVSALLDAYVERWPNVNP